MKSLRFAIVLLSLHSVRGALLLCQVGGAGKDESGTLVMAARTAHEVVLAVDSEVSNAVEGTHEFDPESKLLSVGRASGCTIEGYLGLKSAGVDLPARMRAIVNEHPNSEASEILENLIHESAIAWNSFKHDAREIMPRQVGSVVTALTCAQIIGGKAQILRGQSTIDLTSYAVEGKPSPEQGSFLTVGGYFYDVDGFTNVVLKRSRDLPSNALIAAQLRSSRTFTQAYDRWTRLEKEAFDKSRVQREGLPPLDSALSLEDIHQLFSSTFSAVEKFVPNQVGPPNNILIVSLCGRKRATLETFDWTPCAR